MSRLLPLLAILLIIQLQALCQPCTPQGNQTSYGTNNVWRGYVYDNSNFTTYRGFVTEGTAGSPNFDQSFGGSNTTYSTNGCNTQTETFSIRYKLRRNFSNGSYNFTVGGDDGYRLSLDGGSTWVIDKWTDQAYNTTTYTAILNGNTNIVLEYYENTGDNRITFNLNGPCATTNTNTYGTNNTWRGYIYQGMNFDAYVGMINEGTTTNPAFNENFGGSNVLFATSGCNVQTEAFSARFRLTKTFADGDYTFFIGGDDGYRLSLDGGATWLINNWNDQSYNVSTATIHLNGSYNVVLEYYENGGDNAISFGFQFGSVLDVKLISFNGARQNFKNELNWNISTSSNPDYFDLQKSADGANFNTVASVLGKSGKDNGTAIAYHFTDNTAVGKSFYRLKMVDISGATTYSNIVYINEAVTSSQAIKVFPTIITNNLVTIQSSVTLNNASIMITDMQGRTISSRTLGRLTAGQVFTVPIGINAGLRGIYFARVMENGREMITQKIWIR
jgi:hypothetical protein